MLFRKHYNHKMWQMLNISLQVGTGFNTKVLEDMPFTERLLNTGKQISVIYFFWILTYLFILFRFSPLCWLWFIPFTSVLFIWGFFYSACCFLAFFFRNYLSFFSKRSVSFQFILYCFYDQYLLLTEKPSLSSPMIYLLFSFVCFFSLHSIVSFSLFPTTFNLLYSLSPKHSFSCHWSPFISLYLFSIMGFPHVLISNLFLSNIWCLLTSHSSWGFLLSALLQKIHFHWQKCYFPILLFHLLLYLHYSTNWVLPQAWESVYPGFGSCGFPHKGP